MRETTVGSLLTALVHRPWWVSVLIAGTLYFVLSTVLPFWFRCDASCPLASQMIANFASIGSNAAPVALVFLLPGLISAIRARKDRRLLDQAPGLPSMLGLESRQFESLVAEIYRSTGFRVRENRSDGPDGGVDLRCEGDEGLFLIQCNHWPRDPVGVSVVRELYGVMAAEGAYGGAVVTSGSFTDDAKSFARHLPVELIDGITLQRVIAETQRNADAAR